MDDLEKNRAPLQRYFKICASFHRHWWIQTRATVRKRLSWVMTSMSLTFDLWPWPLAWTSLLSLVITPENFVMTWWWEHKYHIERLLLLTQKQTLSISTMLLFIHISQKGVTYRQMDRQTNGQTYRQTDRRTDWTTHRAAWSQLKATTGYISD